MSIAVPLYGFGTSGGGLYYDVVCQTAEPTKKEGRIWIKSAVPMTYLEWGNSPWSGGAVGRVNIGGTPGGYNPTADNGVIEVFNTKRGGTWNRMKITPSFCKQVQGSTGNWVSVDAYVCHSDTWVKFSSVRTTPDFTYTGDYVMLDDSNNVISDPTTWTGNWKIGFLTSGTLTFTNFNGWDGMLDIFLVGGGGGSAGIINWYPGGGGGGGYTTTVKAAAATLNTAYTVTVGAGANAGSTGGLSRVAIGTTIVATAYGGSGTSNHDGGNGGSGGNSGGTTPGTGAGHDGSDGKSGSNTGGKGQGTTTRAFGEASEAQFAGGGNVGGGGTIPTSAANTGNGGTSPAGGAQTATGKAGYSGIVAIRNKR